MWRSPFEQAASRPNHICPLADIGILMGSLLLLRERRSWHEGALQ